jgi:hypothetical protein
MHTLTFEYSSVHGGVAAAYTCGALAAEFGPEHVRVALTPEAEARGWGRASVGVGDVPREPTAQFAPAGSRARRGVAGPTASPSDAGRGYPWSAFRLARGCAVARGEHPGDRGLRCRGGSAGRLNRDHPGKGGRIPPATQG